MSFTAAIIGRPNVGKSTLFNRLVGQRLALVDDRPGVTRDRRIGKARLGDLEFIVIDTAGLEDVHDNSLESRMRDQTEMAMREANVILMVIDARVGVTPMDRHFADMLRRKSPAPVLLIANKSEGRSGVAGAYESYELGLGEPIALSAEHGEGLVDLFDALEPFAKAATAQAAAVPELSMPEISAPIMGEVGEDEEEIALPAKRVQIAIVGRPNVGKSTLINRLIGEDRLLTGPEAGITRDAIAIDWQWRDRELRLIDTAGLRRKANIEEKLEKLSVSDTLRAIRFAELVVLVLDSTMMLEKQDLAIARMVENEGRAMVIALNKWDLIADKPAAMQLLRDRLQISLPQLVGIFCIPVSGLTGAGLDKLIEGALYAHLIWNRRVSTPRLNRWLAVVQERHPPPLVGGRRLRLRYMTQANIRPPTFALFSSKPGDLPDSYRRYLVNLIREEFDLPGTPIRVMLRKGDNPFAKKD